MERLRYNFKGIILFILSWFSTWTPGLYAVNISEVKTVSLRNADDFMAPTVIRKGMDDKLVLNFDILGDQHSNLRYRFKHQNSDGKDSRLLDHEYIEGFNEFPIEDFAYSSNTYVHYVNYNVIIPDKQLNLLHSGEFVIQIFSEEDPDNIILEVPFSVSENKTEISGNVTSRTDKGYNSEYQQLSFAIDISSFGHINPYQDLIVTVVQNNTPSTKRILKNPTRIEGKKLIYDHQPQLIFDAGNEFRRFETVRADYPGMRVDSVQFIDTNWHAWLREDEVRQDNEYIYDQTQKGRFKVDEYYSQDPDLGADYITVHFILNAPQISGGKIYLDGDITGHLYDDDSMMKYDWQDGKYHNRMLLKQGSYNYKYIVVSDEGNVISSSPIEGNKYETRNEYLVRVYLREPGSRGDRLIGHSVLEFN